MITLPLILLFIAQKPELWTTEVFGGGTFDQYQRFISSSRVFGDGVDIYSERIFAGMGPVRKLKYSDGSIKLDPPVVPFLKFSKIGDYHLLVPTILPEGYCRPDTMVPLSDQDEITQFDPPARLAPLIVGSFVLGNGLPQLGFTLRIHPFFKRMKIWLNRSGSRNPDLLDAVAKCVGGKVAHKDKNPVSYSISPDVEEIRTRAIATLEYFSMSSDLDFLRKREEIYYALVKQSTGSEFSRWLDASIKRDRVSVSDQPWAKEIRTYRTMYFDGMEKLRKGKAGKYSREEYMSMAIYVEFAENLTFGVVLVGSKGEEYWI